MLVPCCLRVSGLRAGWIWWWRAEIIRIKIKFGGENWICCPEKKKKVTSLKIKIMKENVYLNLDLNS